MCKEVWCETGNRCSKCNQEYIKEYWKDNKVRLKEENRIYRNNNKEKLSIKAKQWREKNKEQNKVKFREYRRKNKVKINRKKIERKKIDPCFKLSINLRSRMRAAIKRGFKTGSAVRDLGCTIPEFKAYIESKFQPGMIWDNWSIYGWHLDHILPLASFNLEDREQFLQAANYTNIQPLWWQDNLTKGDRVREVCSQPEETMKEVWVETEAPRSPDKENVPDLGSSLA